MNTTFKLPVEDLSTPERLKEACNAARKWVLEYLPYGDHSPRSGSYFNYNIADRALTGCSCAVGHLLTALCGSMSAVCSLEDTDALLRSFDCPRSYKLFEAGFDEGLCDTSGQYTAGEWYLAGRQLRQEWEKETCQ